MPVSLDQAEFRQVDFGRQEGEDVIVPFPVIYRYSQIVTELEGYAPRETGGVVARTHYGYAPHPVIRIANLISSVSVPVRTLDMDEDGRIWILCHRHRNPAESAAYAHAMLMARDPSSGLPPAAIEYVVDGIPYTIVTRRPPPGGPSSLIVYSATRDHPERPGILTAAIDERGNAVSPEPYLFAFASMPEESQKPRKNQ